jgi:RNA-directed DNA polymerase
VRPAPTNRPVASYKSLCRFSSLEAAWGEVRKNAFRSNSPETQRLARDFELAASTSLKSIQSKLTRKSFRFLPARGVLAQKAGSTKKRPIVIAPIESRIVQRAILDIVQSVQAISSELHAGYNFGGIDGVGFGVPGAIKKALVCAQDGGHFIRTDIKAFFSAVRRQDALDAITKHLADPDLRNIFSAAATVELEDAASFGANLNLFPLADEGVAQGSCLSPLLCNYLLRDFDRAMNARGVTCVRYIDDFILFAKDKATTAAAFKSALRMLASLGLSAYDPFNAADSAKAEHGETRAGFVFLGCEVSPGSVRPTAEKKRLLFEKVQSLFDQCLVSAIEPERAIRSRDQEETLSGAITKASNIVRAWGNTYSFCSDDRLMGTIDSQLNQLLTLFRKRFAQVVSRHTDVDRRRAIGLFCLADCNRDHEPDSARTIALGYGTKKAA